MDNGYLLAGAAESSPVPDVVAALLAPDGQALLAELRDVEVSADSALELGTRLRQRYPASLVASALAQQDLRWRARAKFSRAMDMFFTRDGLEQSSSEPVARHRAGRLAAAAAEAASAAGSGPPVIADLCCGIGGDLIALAAVLGPAPGPDPGAAGHPGGSRRPGRDGTAGRAYAPGTLSPTGPSGFSESGATAAGPAPGPDPGAAGSAGAAADTGAEGAGLGAGLAPQPGHQRGPLPPGHPSDSRKPGRDGTAGHPLPPSTLSPTGPSGLSESGATGMAPGPDPGTGGHPLTPSTLSPTGPSGLSESGATAGGPASGPESEVAGSAADAGAEGAGLGAGLAVWADGIVLAVDRDPVHLAMAAANAAVCGLAGQVRTWAGDVRDAPLDGCAAVFIDPARRDGGRRMAPGASEPPLDWCLSLAERVPLVAIKAAPGLALEDVPPGWETEFIAAGRDLKEAVLWSPALAGAVTRATVLPGGEQLTALPDGAARGAGGAGGAGGAAVAGGVRPPGEYLLDPSPAVTRAGLVRDLAVLTGGRQIDEQIAFLTGDEPLVSPFGRSLRVLDSGPWNQKQLPGRLRAAGAGSVDIRRRGLAGNVEVLHRQLARQLDPAATRRITLVMTRAAGKPWALICEDLLPR